MAYDQNTVPALYKKLLAFYPRGFRERLGESMQQTFNDLYNNQKRETERGWFGFMLWIFIVTIMGLIREHLILLTEGNAMKNLFTNPRAAAITSFILCLPLVVPYVILMYDMKPFIGPLNNLLTVDGQQINNLGRIVFIGGLFLLLVAFVLNLQPMLIRVGPEQKRTIHTVNLIVSAAILLLIALTWGGLILEEIYCLRGIRCD